MFQMLINIPKWLFCIHNQRSYFHLHGLRISTIWVDSAKLTASYYKEYLGFKEIIRTPAVFGNTILLVKHGNWICIKSKKINDYKNDCLNQSITLRTSKIDKEYSILRNKVWLVKPIHVLKENDKTFTVRDCNGIEIVHTNIFE